MFCTDTHLILCVYLDVCAAKIQSTETNDCQVKNTGIFVVSDLIFGLWISSLLLLIQCVFHHPIKCEQNHVKIVVTILGGGPFIIIFTINAIIASLPLCLCMPGYVNFVIRGGDIRREGKVFISNPSVEVEEVSD